MKILNTLIMALLLSLSSLSADELQNAYKKEYTFLKAQKNELEKRIKIDKATQDKDIAKAKQKVSALQNTLVNLSEDLKNRQLRIEKATQNLSDKSSNKEIIGSVIIQAASLLQDNGVKLVENNETTQIQTMQTAFKEALTLYSKLSSITHEKGKFYLLDGSTAEGDIVKVGNIAAYGLSSKASGALAPAGNGSYKIWNQPSANDARAMADEKMPKDINIFIYENLDKEVEYTKEKTLEDTLEGGGTIGYIILALGALGLLLLLVRVFLLLGAGSNVNKISAIVIEKVENGRGDEALEAVKDFQGASARVIKATLRNINKDREHIEDIVMENILNENSSIDRFGNFVLVLAAVAPLLGLLGTVTGMIATFDIITTHGTGDPKLLSGGISEALVTTMLGLVVAIPLLLLGNLLSGWAQNIKDSMEQSALRIVNLFEKHNA